MAATQTVPEYLQHCNSEPIIPRQGVVTLFGYGIAVSVDRGHLVVTDGIGPNRRSARFSRVGHGLKRLVVIGSDGVVSLAALRWLADQKAAFVMLDRVGEVLAVSGPVYPSDARLRRAQSLAENSGTGLTIAVELIRQKLLAQEQLVRKQFLNEASAETISDQRHALMKANSKEEVRRCEAHAALAYWRAWHELPVSFPLADLRRIPDHWRTFGSRLSPLTRSPRLAVNPPNAILNYLYAILEAEARLAIAELGLDPGIGVLHSDTRTRDSLACDLMEPIRPEVDAFVLEWLRTSTLQRKWFFEERDGNCRLTSEFTVRLSETAKRWRQALAPLAERVVNYLANIPRSTANEQPPTRLTQTRRREAKGIPAQNPVYLQILWQHRTPLQPARLSRFDSIAQSRRATSQRRHAAAQRTWNPTENPKWLDALFYIKQIQPRLLSVQTRSIRSSVSVSESYALKIRTGGCVPHPRHWLALAKLARVAN
jgi:CRISPR-associated endonuclease Cas1